MGCKVKSELPQTKFKMTLNLKTQPRIYKNLDASELMILKSLALGLGYEFIQTLMGNLEASYKKHCKSIYSKLGACNSYTAVLTAFRLNILNRKEYINENIKGFALKFAQEYRDRFELAQVDTKKTVWDLYDLLFEFHSQIESNFMTDSIENKKSHRSGI